MSFKIQRSGPVQLYQCQDLAQQVIYANFFRTILNKVGIWYVDRSHKYKMVLWWVENYLWWKTTFGEPKLLIKE